MGEPELAIAFAAKPHPQEVVSGDAWSLLQQQAGYRITVIDGLGHGPMAAAAADEAKRVLVAHPEARPDEALRLCHESLRGSRGAAMAVAQVSHRATLLSYAGVGNIEAQLCSGGSTQRPISYRGIVGAAMPHVRPFDFELVPGWALVMHTDGVSARFELHAWLRHDVQETVDVLLSEYSRLTDDALIVIARHRDAAAVPPQEPLL